MHRVANETSEDFPGRRGVALAGLLGVGKTTMARRLVEEHGMTLIKTVVTRPSSQSEPDVAGITTHDFEFGVRNGGIVFPYYFGDHWYGYKRHDWLSAVALEGAGYIFNVRPYVGIIISEILPQVIPVWLDLAEDIRISRVTRRTASRDAILARSPEVDSKDLVYRVLYRHVIDATNGDEALQEVVRLTRRPG